MCARLVPFLSQPPGGSRLEKTIQEACYWKGLVTQAELFAKACKILQKFKKRKSLYGNLPSKNIAKLKMWDSVHVDLIGPYSKSIIQHLSGNMKLIGPTTSCFKTVKIPTFDLSDLTACNDELIDKSPAKVSQMFNNT